MPIGAQRIPCIPQPAQHTAGNHRLPDGGPLLQHVAQAPTQTTPHQGRQPPAGPPMAPSSPTPRRHPDPRQRQPQHQELQQVRSHPGNQTQIHPHQPGAEAGQTRGHNGPWANLSARSCSTPTPPPTPPC
ncbi:hypothetical protein ILYODFUR_003792 [Ilyodon furcidens]|uniref:Uncharacterized protein n=1 Tax=Ilyodon furcidens TaxID=33524 RepID=A0ABV0T565_9TELE